MAIRSSKVLRWVERFLLVAGLAGIGVWGWSRWHESTTQREDSREFDQKQTSGEPRNAVIPDNGLVGRIRIPRLHVSAMVREGTGAKTLDVAVGHIPGTAFPGKTGNVAVAAHRDTLFRGLRDIRQGDLVEFETARGTYFYRVFETQIVKPQDVWVLKTSSFRELTMVTCYPFNYIGSAPERFIVKARQLMQPQPEPVQIAEARPPRPRPVSLKPLGYVEPGEKTFKVPFEVSANHSRQLAPGISIGLTGADALKQRVEGWMWVMPDRRTIWLRGQGARDPVIFYGHEDGRRRELVITSVSSHAARGYLLVYPG